MTDTDKNKEKSSEGPEAVKASHFIKNIIETDIQNGKNDGQVVTRFPPEPNGFLHIGHSKSIILNHSLAEDYNGRFHLRFDDTNPEKEDEKYVEAIKEDVKWLGADYENHLYFASDYFEKLYDLAVELIKKDKAFVCELTAEQMREYRGTLKEPGKPSPWRDRPIEENIDLFKRMREGEFEEGKYSLRAKIDMGSPNIKMRDPILYRIRKVHHQRTGDKWPIYPMYDFTHCLSDAIEGITHSICTLEFEDHRPLYNWVINECEMERKPQQIEFAKLKLDFTVMGKRYLLQMVNEGIVSGWDDPRMPTVRGLRRRGVTPTAIRNFAHAVGVTKKDSIITLSTLEHAVREDLGKISPRVFGVVNPLKVVITNYPEDEVHEIDCAFHPKDESFGSRKVPFTKEIYIDRDDFMEDPPKKYFRLSPGKSVRLRYAYVITCDEVIKDDQGEITELRCSYHKDSFGGVTPEGMKKVKGIIHWVSATENVPVKINLYDRLFTVPNPFADKEKSFKDFLNPDSLKTVDGFAEKGLESSSPGDRFQFERVGYFIVDQDSKKDQMIFNRTMTLKDTWSKIEGQFNS
ncbi:MAG: glutamine--tRNA ligase/YqeY domain fusion protein [Bacteriovoracaceae bacterium]